MIMCYKADLWTSSFTYSIAFRHFLCVVKVTWLQKLCHVQAKYNAYGEDLNVVDERYNNW